MGLRKYETEEERQAARRETYRKSNKVYKRKLAPNFVRRSHILPIDLAADLDGYCVRSSRNNSDVVVAALRVYLKELKEI